MKITSVSVSYSCKFNDPQKRYMNHNLSAESTATVEAGEDPEQIRQQLANDLEAFVHRRRSDLYRVAELEAKFTEMKRDFKYAVDNISRYEEGTRKAREQMRKANGMYEQLQSVAASLAKLGMSVELPKACIDLAPAKPTLSQPADPDTDGNDPDEAADGDAGIDD